MMNVLPLLDALGWAVLHSVWQGGLAWLAVLVLRRGLPGLTPSLRCNLQIAVLLLTFVAFMATFIIALSGSGPNPAPALSIQQQLSIVLGNEPSMLSDVSQAGSKSSRGDWIGTDRLSSATPFIAMIWAVGFLLATFRYAVGYGAAQRLRRVGVMRPDDAWLHRFARLCHASGLRRSVILRVSDRVAQPLTLGVVKPIVLVPVGFLTALPPDQVEAILLHELGHIRRYDYALNLVQIFVKSVLFYHPAVHAICRLIEQDREQACDDHAVRHGPDGSVLARGLAALRLTQPGGYAMAALGRGDETPLLRRLTRLVGETEATRPEPVFMSALTALLLGSVYLAAPTGARAHPHKPEAPKLIVAAPEAPANPIVLPDTIITPPAPPAPPKVDKTKLDSLVTRNNALVQKMNAEIGRYASQISVMATRGDYDEEEIERLADKIEEIADRYEERIERNEARIEAEAEAIAEAWEEAYGDAFEADMDRWETNFEAYMESEADRIEHAVEQAAHLAEHAVNDAFEISVRNSEMKALQKDVQRSVREVEKAQRAAEKELREASRMQKTIDRRSRDFDKFQVRVIDELMKDGLINDPTKTVRLTHIDDIMSLNGKAMPKAVRGKYCEMIDELGFTDHATEITIKPGSLHITTGKSDDEHDIEMTYGRLDD